MKAFGVFGLFLALQFTGPHANAFTGHDQFKVETVRPWGEFGFRALGKGKHISEMRFDCSKVSEMGLVLSMVNNYGKTNHVVLPAGKLGSDKAKCQESLKQYFAGLYSKRSLASQKEKPRTVEFNRVRGGLFSDDQNKTTLSFL